MSADRTPLFCSTTLAERIERAEVDLLTQGAEAARRRVVGGPSFARPVAGGLASFAEEGSPLNKIAGLGFGGVPSKAELDEIEQAFAARRTPVQVELAHIGDPTIGTLLTGRGYRLVSFENVLGLSLERTPERVTPAGVDVRPSGDDDLDAWVDVVTDGFAHPDLQGVASHEEFPRDIVARAMRDLVAAGVLRYAARCEGALAGGASFRIFGGVAQLAGAATTPAFRRRGVQTALLSARLADAAAAGCDVAVITTQPGSKSQQNAQRRGFDLLYTRAVLVKQP
jgi:GNAT superfamily N-acetyltransferase